jgi:hypothetical protein
MKRTRRLRRLLKLVIRGTFERWTWPGETSRSGLIPAAA